MATIDLILQRTTTPRYRNDTQGKNERKHKTQTARLKYCYN